MKSLTKPMKKSKGAKVPKDPIKYPNLTNYIKTFVSKFIEPIPKTDIVNHAGTAYIDIISPLDVWFTYHNVLHPDLKLYPMSMTRQVSSILCQQFPEGYSKTERRWPGIKFRSEEFSKFLNTQSVANTTSTSSGLMNTTTTTTTSVANTTSTSTDEHPANMTVSTPDLTPENQIASYIAMPKDAVIYVPRDCLSEQERLVLFIECETYPNTETEDELYPVEISVLLFALDNRKIAEIYMLSFMNLSGLKPKAPWSLLVSIARHHIFPKSLPEPQPEVRYSSEKRKLEAEQKIAQDLKNHKAKIFAYSHSNFASSLRSLMIQYGSLVREIQTSDRISLTKVLTYFARNSVSCEDRTFYTGLIGQLSKSPSHDETIKKFKQCIAETVGHKPCAYHLNVGTVHSNLSCAKLNALKYGLTVLHYIRRDDQEKNREYETRYYQEQEGLNNQSKNMYVLLFLLSFSSLTNSPQQISR
jgi:hypothetical protein